MIRMLTILVAVLALGVTAAPVSAREPGQGTGFVPIPYPVMGEAEPKTSVDDNAGYLNIVIEKVYVTA